METRVLIQATGAPPTDEQRQQIDSFVAAFVAKKGLPPAGNWRVPGVGYCVFWKMRDLEE